MLQTPGSSSHDWERKRERERDSELEKEEKENTREEKLPHAFKSFNYKVFHLTL